MKAENENPSPPNRCYLDGVQQTSIIEWNKKRKSETGQQDLPRPKHNCWAARFSSEHGSTSSYDKLKAKSSETHASAMDDDDDISELKSSRGSNIFGEDSSDTAISVNEEAKLQIDDSAEPYQQYADMEALMDLDEHSLALGICAEHASSEYVKDGNDHPIEKESDEIEDVFNTYGANPNMMYILSSGKWMVNQVSEVESRITPSTIDQEFEQYFSMLML